LGKEHRVAHPPQLFTSVWVLTSQPSTALALQFWKPMLHAPRAQRAMAHVADALGKEHRVAHPPQLAGSLVMLISQPSEGIALQFWNPASQGPRVHAPLTQVGVARGKLHALPQVPQLPTDVVRSTSQPSEVIPLQLPRPGMHTVLLHIPMAQLGVPPTVEHITPHPEQCKALVSMLVSQPLAGFRSQSAKRPVQGPRVQTPRAQVALAFAKVHPLPQRPQCEVLVRVSASQPLAGLPSQSAKPVRHAPREQVPAAQTAVALGKVHPLPQRPQLLMSVATVEQVIPHSVCMGGQMIRQVTPPSAATQSWPGPQALPQRPQFIAVAVLVHTPAHSALPGGHGLHIPPEHTSPVWQGRSSAPPSMPASIPTSGVPPSRVTVGMQQRWPTIPQGPASTETSAASTVSAASAALSPRSEAVVSEASAAASPTVEG
jgi:hypothetical protein